MVAEASDGCWLLFVVCVVVFVARSKDWGPAWHTRICLVLWGLQPDVTCCSWTCIFLYFFVFSVCCWDPPPVTTATGPQSLIAGHGVQTEQQASSTSTSIFFNRSGSNTCSNSSSRRRRSSTRSWWAASWHHLVSGHPFNIILWVVIYSTSSCCAKAIGQLVDMILWVHPFNIILLCKGG